MELSFLFVLLSYFLLTSWILKRKKICHLKLTRLLSWFIIALTWNRRSIKLFVFRKAFSTVLGWTGFLKLFAGISKRFPKTNACVQLIVEKLEKSLKWFESSHLNKISNSKWNKKFSPWKVYRVRVQSSHSKIYWQKRPAVHSFVLHLSE